MPEGMQRANKIQTQEDGQCGKAPPIDRTQAHRRWDFHPRLESAAATCHFRIAALTGLYKRMHGFFTSTNALLGLHGMARYRQDRRYQLGRSIRSYSGELLAWAVTAEA